MIMFNFFAKTDSRQGDSFIISGGDFSHVKNVLRMGVGDTLLISSDGASHLCEIESIFSDTLTAKIIEENYQSGELPINIHLFQGLPKSDKLELIIQKCVELGVATITPTEMTNCVVKLEPKKKQSKVERWQSIAEAAAKQSKRSVIPTVNPVLSFKEMLSAVKEMDLFLVPYENERGMAATREALARIRPGMSVGILVGPEGGFEESEIDFAIENGVKPICLGKRILRTETAGLAILSVLMFRIEENQ